MEAILFDYERASEYGYSIAFHDCYSQPFVSTAVLAFATVLVMTPQVVDVQD